MKRGFVFITVIAVAAMLLAGCAAPAEEPTPDKIQTAPSAAPVPGETAPSAAPLPGETTPDLTPSPSPVAQPPSSGPSTGTFTLFVTDAPGYQVENVTVCFSEVEVHVAADGDGIKGGWYPLGLDVPDVTFSDGESKEIVLHGDMEPVTLAEGQLDLGLDGTIKITQIRVHMDEDRGVIVSYIPDPEDPETTEQVSAKLPSGILRFVGPIVMSSAGATVGLDFHIQDSVVWPGAFDKGNQGKDPIFKPVVKLVKTLPEGEGEDEEDTGPAIMIEKEVDPAEVDEPGDVTYTYTVTNEGNIPLHNIVVTDDNATPGDPSDDFNPTPVDEDTDTYNDGDSTMDGVLDPDESWIYTAVRAITEAEIGAGEPIVNVATVTCDEGVSDEASISVTINIPS
jgi:hypothetical protein